MMNLSSADDGSERTLTPKLTTKASHVRLVGSKFWSVVCRPIRVMVKKGFSSNLDVWLVSRCGVIGAPHGENGQAER